MINDRRNLTPKQVFMVEMWREESRYFRTRVIELEDKCQDSGLTHIEKLELDVTRARNHRMFERLLQDIREIDKS